MPGINAKTQMETFDEPKDSMGFTLMSPKSVKTSNAGVKTSQVKLKASYNNEDLSMNQSRNSNLGKAST